MNNSQRLSSSSVPSICKALALLGALAVSTGIDNAGATDLGKTTTTTYIALDGYCDVLTLTVFAWHQAGENDTCNGGLEALGSGMEGKVTGVHPRDLTIGETYLDDATSTYLWNIQYPLATGHTWSIFKSTDGINYTPLNSGTYTVVDSAAAQLPHPGRRAHSASKD